jgi:sec-independent protein translocase protein TatB
MFGMSFGEMMVVLVLALVFVGPKNLPKAARSLGRAYAWARHHMTIIQREINLEMRRLEMQADELVVGPNKKPPFQIPDTRKPYEEKEPAAALAAPASELTTTGNDRTAAPAPNAGEGAGAPRIAGEDTGAPRAAGEGAGAARVAGEDNGAPRVAGEGAGAPRKAEAEAVPSEPEEPLS